MTSNLKFAQRDIKERGLIMARLGDKLMDEVGDVRIKSDLVETKIIEVDKKISVLLLKMGTDTM